MLELGVKLLLAYLLGTVLGMIVAILALSTKPWLRWPAKI